MKRSLKAVLFAAAMLGAPMAVVAAPAPLAPAAVLADPARPAADKALDANRKAAEMLTFIGVRPGDKVADIFPGGGYFTRVFSKAVGPTGKVYGVLKNPPKDNSLTTTPGFSNIVLAVQPWENFNPPEKLDVIFSSQFQHDLYNPQYGAAGGGEAGVDKVNKAMFDALKPGGLFVVVDHAGRPGTGTSEFNTLHRIEKSAVVASLTKAGFRLEGESPILANPADPKTANVFAPEIRGKTDQFVLKFRKPA
jgi:predicted methyltransferase